MEIILVFPRYDDIVHVCKKIMVVVCSQFTLCIQLVLVIVFIKQVSWTVVA